LVDKQVQLAGIVAIVAIVGVLAGALFMASVPGGAFFFGTATTTSTNGGDDVVTAKWDNVSGGFIVEIETETLVSTCTWVLDNYDPFRYGYSIGDGVNYADTCVRDDPIINMIEYSCKTVIMGNETVEYLVESEGTCTLGCRTTGNPNDRNACWSWRRVHVVDDSAETTPY